MRVAVTGAGGMLGTDVVRTLADAGHDVAPLSRPDFDVHDDREVAAAAASADVVVNCAAWTAVDDAETDEAGAFRLNAVVPDRLAAATRLHGAALLHVSTDYVFDGLADEPYPEDAAVRPRSAYGRTKAAGEWAVRAGNPQHWILRTAWLYGAHGPCFPRTIARLAQERDELAVVADQVGQPTWTVDVAGLIARVLERRPAPGIYHATAGGAASWHEFATAVVATAGARARVTPTTSDAFPRPALRPSWSVLGHDRWSATGIPAIGGWRERWEVAATAVLGAGAPGPSGPGR